MTDDAKNHGYAEDLRSGDDREFEKNIHDALLRMKAPESVKTETLAMIEGVRGTTEPHTVEKSASSRRLTMIRRRRRWAAPLSVAACFLLVAILAGVGYNAYRQPAAYVGIDVNPSIELTVNRFDQVVDASALNEDGEEILQQVELRGQSYQEAFAVLMESGAMSSYVSPDAFVDVSVYSDDASLARSLQEQSDTVLESLPCQSASFEVDATMREAAQAVGMGMGRYRVASELVELDDTLTLDSCRSMTMRQMHARIAELCDGTGQSEEHGAGYGEHGAGYGASSGYGAGNANGTGNGNGNGAANGTGNGSTGDPASTAGSGERGQNAGSGYRYGQTSGSSSDHGKHHGSTS